MAVTGNEVAAKHGQMLFGSEFEVTEKHGQMLVGSKLEVAGQMLVGVRLRWLWR